MRVLDLLDLVRGDLERNVRRTVLTMFGLVVGSAAVVTVTSVGLTGREYAVQQLESLGSNLVYAMYDGPTPSPDDLTEVDFRDVVRRATALAAVSRVGGTSSTLNVHGEEYDVAVVGTDGTYARVRNIVLREGRFLTDADVQERRKVCVISETLAGRLFGHGQRLGRRTRLAPFDFQVVGVFQNAQSFSIPTELAPNAVFIPISVLAVMNNSDVIGRIYGQAKNRTLVDSATRQVAQILAANHGRDVIYRVGNLGEVLNVIQRVSRGLILVVGVVSALSLLVGGIGIMNIMLVTVRERTPEIGIRKALGASPRQILNAFLLEAIVLSIVGGLVGILIGSSLPVVLGALFEIQIPISALSILVALGVSAAVGIGFGYYPARRAARLHPVQAIRQE